MRDGMPDRGFTVLCCHFIRSQADSPSNDRSASCGVTSLQLRILLRMSALTCLNLSDALIRPRVAAYYATRSECYINRGLWQVAFSSLVAAVPERVHLFFFIHVTGPA
jgi:hypothetical protein